MIRHTLSFRFEDGVDAATRERVLAGLREFPARYPSMQNFTLGENISTRDRAFTHTMAVDFDSEADLVAYLSSDSHESFVRDQWRPVIGAQAITSFEYTAPSAGAGRSRPMSTRPHGPFGMEYARIEVPDLQAAIDFLQYHVGLQLEQHTEDYAYLRADIEHHSIELVSAPHLTDGVTTAVGFSVESEEILEQLQKRVVDAGLEVLALQERQQQF